VGFARSLGQLPDMFSRSGLLDVELRSDLWIRPHRKKDTPVRKSGVALGLPTKSFGDWVGAAQLTGEDLSLSRTDLVVGKDRIQIGTDLQARSVGASLMKVGDRGGYTQGLVSLESYSDRPFRAPRDQYVSGLFLHAQPAHEGGQWLFGVHHSDNRGLLDGQPLPLIFYKFIFSELSDLVVGPLFLHGQIRGDLGHLELLATPVSSSLSYNKSLGERLTLFSKGGVNAWSYMHSERMDSKNRLYYQEHFIEMGAKVKVDEGIMISNVLGHSFDRSIYEGRQVYISNSGREKLAADIYMTFKLAVELW